MSEYGDAIEGMIGLIAGGILLLLVGSSIDAELGTNLTVWGGLFLLVAMFLSVLLIVGVVKSIVEGL